MYFIIYHKFKNTIIIVEKQGGQATVFIRIMSMLLDVTVFVIITSMLITRCDILAPRIPGQFGRTETKWYVKLDVQKYTC